MRSELQKNTLAHLHRTLADLSAADRQISYKRAVPFVHVPIELLEQWSGNARMLRECSWFRELFDQKAAAAMREFDRLVELHDESLGEPTPDIPEILALPAWQAIMAAAADLLRVIPAEDERV